MGVPRARKKVFPQKVAVDICSLCKGECMYCFHQRAKLVRPMIMKPDLFYPVLDILHRERVPQVILYMSGEPFLNPHVYDYLRKLAERRMKVMLATRMDQVDMDRFEGVLRVFEDSDVRIYLTLEVTSTCPEVHRQTCPGIDFDKVWENLERLVVLNRELRVLRCRLRTLVTRLNESDVENVGGKLRQMGFENWDPKELGFYMIYEEGVDLRDVENMLPVSSRYRSRVDVCDGEIRRLEPPGGCLAIRRIPFVSPEGNVTVCCHDMLYRINVGNVLEANSIVDVLSSREYEDTFRRGRSRELSICKGCS